MYDPRTSASHANLKDVLRGDLEASPAGLGGPVAALVPLPFLRAPTPLQPWVSDGSIPLRGRLWVKDEAHSGRLYGGNKVRKLAYVLAEAQRLGRRHLVTVGGVGSHHVLATAVWGRSQGMFTHALLLPQPDTPHVRAVARHIETTCASWTALHRPATTAVHLARLVARVTSQTGERPHAVAVGGSSVIGTLGWLDAGLELAEQVRAGECETPSRVYVAVGSGGTAAGLMAGLALAGLDAEVVGVRVVPRSLANTPRVRHLARRVLRHRDGSARLGRFRWMHGFYGGGYGVVTPEAVAAVAAGDARGLPIETTYSGKALAACLSEVRTYTGNAVFVQTASFELARSSGPLGDLSSLLRVLRPY